MMSSDPRRLVQEDCAEAVAGGALELLEPLRGAGILVTGGTGFMGTWLTETVAHLNDHHGFGARVWLLCTRAESFSAQAAHLVGRRDVVVVERDVRNLVEIPAGASWIVHAAGSPDNRLHASDPLRTIHTVVNGTDAVLGAATRLARLDRFLNISSGLVYGPQPGEMDRIAETFRGPAECGSVASAYGEAKRMGETLCAAYRSEHRIPVVNVRPFAFVGPYQHLDRPWALNNFLQDSLRGGPIRIQGSAKTVRSYMYGSDMAVWLLGLLAHGKVGSDYNLGSPDGVELRDLAELISRQYTVPVEVTSAIASPRASHPSRFVPDVTLAAGVVGSRPRVGLEAAIRRTIRWHQAREATTPLQVHV